MRILAVDPVEKRLGIALSDPSGTIASPLTVLKHLSRPLDAAAIASLAHDHEAGCVLVGQALDDENQPTQQSRRAERLAEAIRQQTSLPVILWAESGTTQAAWQASRLMGVPRRKRQGHLDDLAAAALLQSYLDRLDNLETPPDRP